VTAFPCFTPADPARHRDLLLELNIEYMSWVAGEMEAIYGISAAKLNGLSTSDYVAGTIDKTCGDTPPRGIFYLVEQDGAVAGMGGLRSIRDGVAEIKRIYVRSHYRGAGLGQAILQRLLTDAAAFGYRTVVLDSAPFMHSAHRLYQAAGFVDCLPYPESEAPPALRQIWRFMERVL
jgi:GNAT superfamily N-acetyltransferase